MTATRKSSYHPGTPGEVIPQGHGRYIVESFRNSGEFYAVDLNENTCSCPHTEYRHADDCKHRRQARFTAYLETREKAMGMDVADLKTALFLNDYRPEVREAIDWVVCAKERETAHAAL